jgi:hypothetical protein
MEITLLIKLIAGLVAILGFLLFLFFYSKKSKTQKKSLKKKSKKGSSKREEQPKFKDLMAVIRDKNATTQELSDALDALLKYYGKIPAKLGIRTHPEFYAYAEILLRICRHKNINKELIVYFDKELEKRNPDYIREINDALMKGLNSRGF